MASAATNSSTPAPDVREQDRFLPIANISRIMKKSLPPNAKIAKDAKETVQVSSTLASCSTGVEDMLECDDQGSWCLWACLTKSPTLSSSRLVVAQACFTTLQGNHLAYKGIRCAFPDRARLCAEFALRLY